MKKMILVLALVMAWTFSADAHRYFNRHRNVTFFTFYRTLAPYGEWVNTSEYGYAWVPYTDDADFKPYSTRGNWAYTDYGWTWVSDYRWGWAPFHYGRWQFDDYYGWMWVPGYEWAPAWVTWGEFDNCYAWAPMAPFIEVNVNINWCPPAAWWSAVPYNHFCDGNWHNYAWNRPVRVTNITNITNVYYGDDNRHSRGRGNWYHGPRVEEVERRAGTAVTRVDPERVSTPRNEFSRNDPREITARGDNGRTTRQAPPDSRSNESRTGNNDDHTRKPPVFTQPGNDRTGTGRNGTEVRTNRETRNEGARERGNAIENRNEGARERGNGQDNRHGNGQEVRRTPPTEVTHVTVFTRDPKPAVQPRSEVVNTRPAPRSEPTQVRSGRENPKPQGESTRSSRSGSEPHNR